MHQNAKLTPAGRALLVRRVLEESQAPVEVGRALGVSRRTVVQVACSVQGRGVDGAQRSVLASAREPYATREVAALDGEPGLRRLGISRLRNLEPKEKPLRYERSRPGELVDIDTKKLGIRHIRTRPYRPQTNGEAERFIQTALREWAYRRPYPTSAQRTAALPSFQRRYNERRRHTALGGRPPFSRLQELV